MKVSPTSNMGGEYECYEKSRDFDFDSIMIYSSFAGGEHLATSNLAQAVMTRRGPNGQPAAIHQGGSHDPRLARPSQGDIDRVKALYPLIEQQSQAGDGSGGVEPSGSQKRPPKPQGPGARPKKPAIPRV